jgi:hypothetical protein
VLGLVALHAGAVDAIPIRYFTLGMTAQQGGFDPCAIAM